MRVFISLELPKKIKKEIGKIQQELKKTKIKAKWVKPKMAHLTLAFLGSITPNKIEPVGKILKKVGKEIKPIRLHFLKLGCFPHSQKARVVFLDLGGELDKLNVLARKIRQQLKKEKIWFDDKPFSGHITLARTKRRQNLTHLIKEVKIKQTQFITDKISLNQSQLTRFGPLYKKLKSTSLKT